MPRLFPNWLQAYVDFAKDSEAPAKFHFWSGVSVLAGALRRRVWLDMHKFQWTPNFYIILVAPAGVVQKSTTMGVGLRLLEKVPGIHFGPESMTWQALAQSLSLAAEYCEYVDFDGLLKRTPMSCLTIGIGELGTFLRTDDDQLLSFLIRMWDGQADKFRHETKSSGNIEVDHPWLNLIAATTPAWLRANFPETMVGGGLTSRVVFVYGDKKRQLVPYPDEVIPHADYRRLEADLITDLTAISQLAGPYILSSQARGWGRDWYTRHNDPSTRPPHLASDRFGGYLARKQTHLHKFALVLAAAKRDKLIIEQGDLEEAEKIITANEQDMIRVFESIGVVDEARHVNEIVTFVRHIGGQSVKDLWSRSMNFMSYVEFQAALRAAVQGNLLTMIKHSSTGDDFVLFNQQQQGPLQ